MVIRCTAKALQLLGVRAASLPVVESADDDWYVNLLWFDRRKSLLFTHAGTCFSVFAPDIRKADLDPVGPFLVEAITAALEDEALPHDVLGVLDPAEARIAKTASRRVLGVMNEIAYHLDYMLVRYGSVSTSTSSPSTGSSSGRSTATAGTTPARSILPGSASRNPAPDSVRRVPGEVPSGRRRGGR